MPRKSLITADFGTTSTLVKATLNATGAGNTLLVAKIENPNQRIRIASVLITNNDVVPVTIHFQSNTTRISADHRLMPGAGWSESFRTDDDDYFAQTAEGEDLNFNMGAAGVVGVDIGYLPI